MTIVVGLMSGTSLDGISAGVARFTEREGRTDCELLSFAHRDYSSDERVRIERAMQGGSAKDYCMLDVDLGTWLSEAATLAINESGIARADIAGVASHGHTIWHEPGHSTWQMGDAATIAERTGLNVISNFRTRDVAAGGQGAPLVPMADTLLFSHDTNWRALQNLGGIGNVTIVPPRNHTDMKSVRAFDTGPGVVIIDAVTRKLYPDLAFDVDGRIARTGRPIDSVINDALSLPFFKADPPKSTGRELFTPAFIEAFIANCQKHGASDADIVATAVHLTARSIAGQYARFIPEPIADVLLSGGGARNPALFDAISAAITNTYSRASDNASSTSNSLVPTKLEVKRFDTEYFDGEAKEVVAFALLGYLHLSGRAGNVPSATGARGSRRLGELTPA